MFELIIMTFKPLITIHKYITWNFQPFQLTAFFQNNLTSGKISSWPWKSMASELGHRKLEFCIGLVLDMTWLVDPHVNCLLFNENIDVQAPPIDPRVYAPPHPESPHPYWISWTSYRPQTSENSGQGGSLVWGRSERVVTAENCR